MPSADFVNIHQGHARDRRHQPERLVEQQTFSCKNVNKPASSPMSLQSKIEWTEATWNPVRGCVKISPGCKHCYAETFAERFRNVPGHPYEHGFDPRLVPEK